MPFRWPSMLKDTLSGLMFLLAAATLMVLALHHGAVAPRPAPSRPSAPVRGGRRAFREQLWHQCRNVLLMSQLQFPWEVDGRRRRCRKTHRSVEEMLEGLRKLQKSQPGERAANVVFIGDSRVYGLQSTLMKKLNMRPANFSNVPLFYSGIFYSKEELRRAIPSSEKLSDLRSGCTEAKIYAPPGAGGRARCSLAGETATLRGTSWWRPFLQRRFGERLDALLAECEVGRCADLVVLSSGPWYVTAERYPGEGVTRRVVRFIADLAAQRARIARLAAATKVVWKDNEPFMPEIAYGRKWHITRSLMVLSAVVHEAASRVPRLSVWTSGVAEVTQFYHSVCVTHRSNFSAVTGPVRGECRDPMHVGKTLSWRMLQTLFNVLLFDVNTPSQGLCCGS
ncbi:uncharacterized protein LOC122367989 [Amphibalanus amphitrite]|uniref:uncharacterized protein LOC122367989 n=1 Tax=Amphibalanus amphitrite TaxID=1232801 RepID=UPI001C90FB36|nr:uncharacterized protein LOC122367989 [Amphibalanus amphitrite]